MLFSCELLFLFIYSQGKIPVKWLAVESLEQRLYTSQSDVLVFVQFVTSSLLLLSLLIIFHDKLSYCQMNKSNCRSFFAVDRCFCCVGPGFSIITADPPKKQQNSKRFCVYTVFYFYKSSLLYPDLQAVLFRRWSFGVLLWEIETGGEFCCLVTLPPCESSAKDRDLQS